ncbi:DUF4166 domain-containing protein [Ensifer soli]|uniref:DUF4166 domain-containing protein n=1 Tax=Ciceribacter sp. sgz301302 TaxID=3342379 RepID=UPI0035BA2A74
MATSARVLSAENSPFRPSSRLSPGFRSARGARIGRVRPPLCRRVTFATFDRLPPAVRETHGIACDGGAAGRTRVRRGRGLLSRMIAAIMAFPPEGEHALHVTFEESDRVECWTRDFGGHRFSSTLPHKSRRLAERFGPLRFSFDLLRDPSGLSVAMRGRSALGLPLPLPLAPLGAGMAGGRVLPLRYAARLAVRRARAAFRGRIAPSSTRWPAPTAGDPAEDVHRLSRSLTSLAP